ncbi:MAG: ribose-phosphate pyrophosphokinase [Lachnospiraceae bacterium]|nr:ribose-phosphate pyrophosphokinase [Lachnospiraceae bacterium]
MPQKEENKTDIFATKLAVAPLKLLVMPNIKELGDKIDQYLVDFRKERFPEGINDPEHQGYMADSYQTGFSVPRFGSGEGKAVLGESIRGKDLYILTDVINYSMTYEMNGFRNRYSPDDHYQDLKRVIAAVGGKAHRITVVMPFMYESRQHKRSSRESLDCAMMIEELSDMGVSDLMTFDAHDPSVQAAAPLCGFDNFTPFYQFIRALLKSEDDLMIDAEHVVVISPDEGALNRAIYFASVLGVDTGMFYKRRDYAHIVDGKNPIVAHEFLGDSIEGKDVIIVDDMISTGGSMLDTARQLKEMKANRVFICCTFGLFTEGLEMFDEAFEKGYFDRIITTNLHYRRPELLTREWYLQADMSKLIAQIIDYSNHDVSMDKVVTPTEKIREILSSYNEHVDNTERQGADE